MTRFHSNEQGNYKPIDLQQQGRPPLPNDRWPYNGHPNDGHDRQYGVKDPKHARHLFVRRDQLLHDIDSQIQMVAMSRRSDDGGEDDRMTSATTTFASQFDRWMEQSLGRAKSAMGAFVLEPYTTTGMNGVRGKEEVDVELLMPEWYDDTLWEQLCQSVHDYIVNETLYQYFVLTLTSKDPVTQDKRLLGDEALNNIRKYVQADKPGSLHKPLKPF